MKNKYIRGLALGMAAMTAFTFTTPQTSLLSVEAATATKATKGTSKITASKKTVKVAKGNTATVKLTLNKKQAKDLKITVKSKSSKIAKVTNAKKVIVKKGKKVASVKIKGVKANSSTKVVASFKTSAGKTKKVTITVKVNPIALSKVTLNNKTPKVGDKLTATISPSNASAVSYKWYMGDSASDVTTVISGQTKKTLNVTEAMAGKFIKVTATGKTAAGKAASKSATTTAAVVGNTTPEPTTPDIVDTKVAVTGVTLSNLSPKVGETVNANLTPKNANNVASYKWEALDTATAETGAQLSSNSSVVVSNNEVGKFIRVTVTDSDGKAFAATSTSAVTENNTATITVSVLEGLQSDGTALVGDTLHLSYGSGLGVPELITWYYNETVAQSERADSGTGLTAMLNLETGNSILKDGKYYAVITNKDGSTFTSNTITMVYDEQPAEIETMDLSDDYETVNSTNIEFDDDNDLAIITVNMKKFYEGTFYIYEDGVVNYSNSNYTNKMVTDSRVIRRVTTRDKLTAKNVMDKTYEASLRTNVAKTGQLNTDRALMYVADNGATTLMYVIDNAAGDVSKNTLKRGKSYKLAFDQKNITSDDITAASKKDVKTTTSIAAPYVKAPEKLVLVTSAYGQEGKIQFQDANGEILAWIDKDTAGAAQLSYNTAGFDYISIFGNDSAKEDDKTRVANAGYFKKGEYTTEKLKENKTIYWAEAKTLPGIYGESAVTLKTDYKTKNIAIATYAYLKESEETPTTAVVKLKDVAAPSKVYVYNETKNGTMDFDPADSSTYENYADVSIGQGEVTIPNVFEKERIGQVYTAILVPNDEDAYARLISTIDTEDDDEDDDKTDDIQKMTLKQEASAFDFSSSEAATGLGTATLNSNGVLSLTGLPVTVKNQFGETLDTAKAYKTATNKKATVAAMDKGGLVAEGADAVWSYDGTNGLTVTVATNNKGADKDDGYKVSLLGSTIEIKALAAISANAANIGAYSVKLGSDKLTVENGAGKSSGTTTDVTNNQELISALADGANSIAKDEVNVPSGATIGILVTDKPVVEENDTLTIKEGAKLTVSGTLTVNGTLTIEEGAEIDGTGTIDGAGTFYNYGTLSMPKGNVNMTESKTFHHKSATRARIGKLAGYVALESGGLDVTTADVVELKISGTTTISSSNVILAGKIDVESGGSLDAENVVSAGTINITSGSLTSTEAVKGDITVAKGSKVKGKTIEGNLSLDDGAEVEVTQSNGIVAKTTIAANATVNVTENDTTKSLANTGDSETTITGLDKGLSNATVNVKKGFKVSLASAATNSGSIMRIVQSGATVVTNDVSNNTHSLTDVVSGTTVRVYVLASGGISAWVPTAALTNEEDSEVVPQVSTTSIIDGEKPEGFTATSGSVFEFIMGKFDLNMEVGFEKAGGGN